MHRLVSSTIAFAATALLSVQAQNPAPAAALEGFAADPSIRVFGGDTYYLYPTSDKPNWMTTDFSVRSSKNLIEWKKERMVLDVSRNLKWDNIKASAPDAVERSGTFQPGDVGEPIVNGKGRPDRPNYLLAHFTSETTDGEQIYFATSQDGYRWSDLNGSKPVLRSTLGEQGVRDPAIVRSPQGDRFWILATDLRIANGKGWQAAMHKGSTKLMIWESTNLVDWSAPRLVDVAGAIPDAGNAWAPEAIHDERSGDYLVYWATISPAGGVTKPRIYYSRTRDFVSFTPATLYIDRPGTHGLIDTQIVKVDDPQAKYRYVRASGDGQLTLEGANELLGRWDVLGDLRPLGLTGKDVEGPILFKVAQSGEWAMWVDQYARKAGYLALTSDDLSRPERFRRTDPARIDYGNSKKRHGSILNISSDEYRRIQARWPVAAPSQANQP